MFLQRLFLLVALAATLVVLGCWDNRREMGYVLDKGYETVGRVAGAQFTRKAPIAIDGGWRPRFVEQELAVDLSWKGRDGKDHEHKKVPVSESFARTIVSGDQVRLMPVAIKTLDDDLDVPVIVLDAARRQASLETWSRLSGAAAVAAWLAFAVLSFGLRRSGQRGAGAAGRPASSVLAKLPPIRSGAGFGLVMLGTIVAYQASVARDAAEAARTEGTAVTADILSVTPMGKGHALLLAWKDPQGDVRHFGPVPISDGFYGEITKDGQLTVHQTDVRYSPDPEKRPVIVADAGGHGLLAQFGVEGGLALMALGAGILFSAFRKLRRR